MRAPKFSQPMRYSQIEKAAMKATRRNFERLRADVRDLRRSLRKIEKKLPKR